MTLLPGQRRRRFLAYDMMALMGQRWGGAGGQYQNAS